MKSSSLFSLLIAMEILLAGESRADTPMTEIVVPDLRKLASTRATTAADYRVAVVRNVRVTGVTGSVDIQAGKPHALLSQTLANDTDKDFFVTATLSNLPPKALTLTRNAETTVEFQVPLDVRKGRNLHSVKIAPQLLIDDALLLAPVSNHDVTVILPLDAKKLVASNKMLVAAGRNNGRLTYRWAGKAEYMTPLQVWWTTSDTDLSLTKQLKPDWSNNDLTVSIKVKNNGPGLAKAVVLKEEFPVQQYAGIDEGSEGQFSVYRGVENDRRLLWEYSLPDLGPGQEKVVTYHLKMDTTLDIAALYETRAVQEGEAVAMSGLAKAERPSQ